MTETEAGTAADAIIVVEATEVIETEAIVVAETALTQSDPEEAKLLPGAAQ